MTKRDPKTKLGTKTKEDGQGSSNNHNDIHTGHNECFITVGIGISESEYSDTQDSIDLTDNDYAEHEGEEKSVISEEGKKEVSEPTEPSEFDHKLSKG